MPTTPIAHLTIRQGGEPENGNEGKKAIDLPDEFAVQIAESKAVLVQSLATADQIIAERLALDGRQSVDNLRLFHCVAETEPQSAVAVGSGNRWTGAGIELGVFLGLFLDGSPPLIGQADERYIGGPFVVARRS